MAEIITMPKLGFDMAEGTLVRWLKKEGEVVNKGDVIAEIETDKATVEVESTISGIIRSLLVEQGSILPINQPIAIIGSADEDIASEIGKINLTGRNEAIIQEKQGDEMQKGEIDSLEVREKLNSERIKISPLAKRLADERGISLDGITGTGSSGRIVRRDIEKQSLPDDKKIVENSHESLVQLSKLRLIIGNRMFESKTKIPHFYVTRGYRVEKLFDLRNQYNESLKGSDKISVNDLFVRAVALSLNEYKRLFSFYQNETILQHSSINIGIAVAVEGGLMTVVCKDAGKKTLLQISRETQAMTERARAGKVKPTDIEGSNFSISNLGMYDVDDFTAIINPPETAILALGAAKDVPVVDNGSIRIGKILYATISVDHRVSDGAEAAKFLQRLEEFLQSPLSLFVD